jgi:hypothetical protein
MQEVIMFHTNPSNHTIIVAVKDSGLYCINLPSFEAWLQENDCSRLYIDTPSDQFETSTGFIHISEFWNADPKIILTLLTEFVNSQNSSSCQHQ